MDRTILAAVIGAVGGFVVWLFSWFWTLYSERKIGTRIRTMLSLEIEENLTALRAFCSAAENRQTLTASHFAGMQRRDAFATAPLPTFKHGIWESLVASIPLALREREIPALHWFHFGLNELTRQKALSEGLLSSREWRDSFERQINELLQIGNPLKGRTRK
jgi:hypothetical protein